MEDIVVTGEVLVIVPGMHMLGKCRLVLCGPGSFFVELLRTLNMGTWHWVP